MKIYIGHCKEFETEVTPGDICSYPSFSEKTKKQNPMTVCKKKCKKFQVKKVYEKFKTIKRKETK